MRNAKSIGALAVVAVLAGIWLATRSTEEASRPDPEVTTSAPSAPAPSSRHLGSSADDDSPEPGAAQAPNPLAPPSACALASETLSEMKCDFLEPDRETLLEMARCGIARLDTPLAPPPGSGLGMFPPAWLELAGVGEAEHERLEQAAAAFMAQQRTHLAELGASVGIAPEWSEATVPAVVVTRITAEFEEEQVTAAIDRVARERAGLETDDAELPPTLEAVVRLRLDTGDAFEAAIAEVVGEARAAELRAAADGWPGGRSYLGNHCERPPIPPAERRVIPRSPAEAKACVADIRGQQCAFLDPNQLELDQMADCGMVRINIPHFLSDRSVEPSFGQAWADEVGLTLDEEAALAEVSETYRESLYAELTEMLLAAGKSQAWIDQTSLLGLIAAVHEISPMTDAEEEAMLRKIAAEKAGRIPPPEDLSALSPFERMTRLNVEFGDILERNLGERLGVERAAELRRAQDGWPGPRIQSTNYCDESVPQLL